MPTKVEKIPAASPTSFSKKEAISFAYRTSISNKIYFLKLFALMILISIGTWVLTSTINKNVLLYLLLQIISWVINTIIAMGIISIALSFVDGKKPKVLDIFYTKSILKFIVVQILTGLIIIGGLILFIIPGIIFAIKLQFSSYFVVDKGMGITEAINSSWKITKGVKFNLYLFAILLTFVNLAVVIIPLVCIIAAFLIGFAAHQLVLVIIPIAIIAIVWLIVGLFITTPLNWVATAYVYRKLLARAS